MNRELAIYEAKQLAVTVKDHAVVANFINKVHGTNWHVSDIEKILMGIDPVASIPRVMAGVRVVVGEALPSSAPLKTTNDNGVDPLAKALFAYHAKRTTGETKAYWERLAA